MFGTYKNREDIFPKILWFSLKYQTNINNLYLILLYTINKVDK